MKSFGRIGAGLRLCAGLCALWLGAASTASAGKPLRGTKVALLHDTHGKGHAGGRGGRGSAKKKRVRYRPPEMPKQLDLVSVDLEIGVVQVDVMGVARPPESRLFVLTDERARRFVPQSSACAPSGESASASAGLRLESGKDLPADASAAPRTWRCALVLPRLYRRAALTGLAMEWGDKQVSAPGERVQTRWAEARAVTPLNRIGIGSPGPGAGETQTEIAPLPSAAPPSMPAEDGPAIDADTLDEGAEEEEN